LARRRGLACACEFQHAFMFRTAFALSVKNQRFLPALPWGEPSGARTVGDAGPYNALSEVRWGNWGCSVIYNWLYTSSDLANARPPSPQGEGLGAVVEAGCGPSGTPVPTRHFRRYARGRHWVRCDFGFRIYKLEFPAPNLQLVIPNGQRPIRISQFVIPEAQLAAASAERVN